MPSLAWNYSTLFDALKKWPNHASALYLGQLPTIIKLGERRLWGDLNIEEYDKILDDGSIKTTPASRIITKPADVIVPRTLALHVVGKFVYLEKRSSEYCQMFAPDPTVTAVPALMSTYYFEDTFAQVQMVPTPDAQYNVYWRYLGDLPESLSSSSPNSATWLSRAAPDGLFAACLAEAEHLIKADDRYQDFMSKYANELLPRIRAELRSLIRAGDRSPMQVAPVLAQ